MLAAKTYPVKQMKNLPKSFKLSKEIRSALEKSRPVVALESAVITHGLPHSHNLLLARELEEIVRREGAAAATIAILDGRVCVGLEVDELKRLATLKQPLKLSCRDLAGAIAAKASGGTTVAGTLRLIAQVGIHVFATGGIGGVHRGGHWDVSADLAELAKQQVLVVCAGAKAILDLPATLEQLETLGVPVIGYQTGEFPAFYSIESGLPTSATVDTEAQAIGLARAHWVLGGAGLLLACPPPKGSALPRLQVEGWIGVALEEAMEKKIAGPAITPFLLQRVNELSGAKSLEANLALLKNNARIAARVVMKSGEKRKGL